MSTKTYEPMTAWACTNSILRFCGLDETLFAEWNAACKQQPASQGEWDADGRFYQAVNPIEAAHLIISWRVLSPAHAQAHDRLMEALEMAGRWAREERARS